ncbi:MAG: hypothetical protein J7K36_03785 [Archaeoglobaceae archaeon]|nr:hypothetical protein [Archaeoglobaceae archaeon]
MIEPLPKKRLREEWKVEEVEFLRDKVNWLEDRVDQLEEEKRWLEREVEETYTELLEERRKRYYLEKWIHDNLLKSKPPLPTSLWESERLNEAERLLEMLRGKIARGEDISKDELKKLIEIDILADKHPELKKSVREVIIMLEKITPAEVIELKEGEIKEIDEDMIVRKKKDGVVEVIAL